MHELGPITLDELIAEFTRREWKGSPSGIRSRTAEAVADDEIAVAPEAGESAAGNRARRFVAPPTFTPTLF